MTAEWLPRGNQLHRIQRYCSQQAAIAPVCLTVSSNDDTNFIVKDCKTSCVGDENREDGANGCNNNNDVELYFSSEKVTSCQSCHYNERDEGNDGDIRCKDGLAEPKTCERYEDNGCYEAGNWHTEDGVTLGEQFRGCSSFPEEAVVNKCDTMEIDSVDYTICKNWCDENQCNNNEVLQPHMCFECVAVLNQFNRTVGAGSQEYVSF